MYYGCVRWLMTSTGLNIKFSDDLDPNVIAGLLKLFVRELPEPLLPFDMYTRFTTISLEKGKGANEFICAQLMILLRSQRDYQRTKVFTLRDSSESSQGSDIFVEADARCFSVLGREPHDRTESRCCIWS